MSERILRGIEGVDVAGKKVLMRVDFNVEFDEHQDVLEKYKLQSAAKTLKYLMDRGARVALATHFGRPDGLPNPAYSLQPIVDDIERIFGFPVVFVVDCLDKRMTTIVEALQPGQIALLENVRFYPGEEKNDVEFAKRLAAPFDLFVNEAFSVCHRDQASVTGVTEFLPAYAGFHLLDEVAHLSRVLSPEHPAVAIIGGAKIETKLPVLQAFAANYDAVLVGSKIADESIAAGMTFTDNVKLPTDYAENHMDVGPESIATFVEIITNSKTVVWNGPLGKFEISPYDTGTRAIVEAMASAEAFTVAGGGESVQVLENWGLFNKINFVSTGGGAMLDFLAGASMPGLDRLAE